MKCLKQRESICQIGKKIARNAVSFGVKLGKFVDRLAKRVAFNQDVKKGLTHLSSLGEIKSLPLPVFFLEKGMVMLFF